MPLTRIHRDTIFISFQAVRLGSSLRLGEGARDPLSVSARTCSRRGRGQYGAMRRVSGALAAVRGFSCAGRSAGGGGSEWYLGLDSLKGPCGDPEEDGWLCPCAWGPCVCTGGMLGDEVGSLRFLSRCTHCLETLRRASLLGNATRDLDQVSLL